MQYSDDNTTFTRTNPATIYIATPDTFYGLDFNSSGAHRFWRINLEMINTPSPDVIYNVFWYYID